MVLVSVVNFTLLGLSVPKNRNGSQEAMLRSQKRLGHSFTPASGQSNTFLYTTT